MKSELNLLETPFHIEEKFLEFRQQNKKALTIFLTAGYPKKESTVPLALLCAEAGVDILEIGMPFSDPLADGPVIQECSQQALLNGVTLPWIFEQVKDIRHHKNIPIVLMGYLSPILRYGVDKFFADAHSAGVDGLILPEVPLEEVARFEGSAKSNAIALILLVTPTTPSVRVREIDKKTRGFLYCVSATGVTGHSAAEDEVIKHVSRIKKIAKHPVLVGFGINNAEQAHAISSVADGIIIGSAFLKLVKESSMDSVAQWLRGIRAEM